MHPRILAAILVLAVSTPVALSVARPAAAVPAGQEDESPLGQAMEGIRADMKALGKAIDAKDGASAWKTVGSLQGHIIAAKHETPPKASSIPEDERDAWMTDFRTRLSQLLRASCDLEVAALAGDFKEAGHVYQDVMWPMQKPAHQKFRND